MGVQFQLVQTRTDLYLNKGINALQPFRGVENAPTLVRGCETGYLILIEKMRNCDVKGRHMIWDSGPQTSFFLRTLADSAEQSGKMVTDRGIVSRRIKRGRSTGIFLRGIPTFASVILIVLAQKGGLSSNLGCTPASALPSTKRQSENFLHICFSIFERVLMLHKPIKSCGPCDEALIERQCQNWFAKIRSRDFSLKNEKRYGRPLEDDDDHI